jgi:hypothetical protein
MFLDSTLAFDPLGTLITVTASSTNILDMDNGPRDMGIGHELRLMLFGNNGFAASGAATLNIQLQGSPDMASWVTYAESGVRSIAQLNAGTAQSINLFRLNLPGRIGNVMPRYYRLNYVVATGPFTAGALGAYLALG